MLDKNGCAVPTTAHIKDLHAERVVLSGLLRVGRSLLGELKTVRGHFYNDLHGQMFDLCCYACYGRETGGPVLVDTFQEARNRGLTNELTPAFFCEVWFTDYWFSGLNFWTGAEGSSDTRVWAALAAAAKIEHLAARRHAIYTAHELIRDALDPTGDAAYIRGRTDRLTEEY